MRYSAILLSILLLPNSAHALVTDAQYTDATNEVKAIFEIIDGRGRKCDAALDAIGIEAVDSSHCKPFMDSGPLIAKVQPQCTVLLQWTDENPLKNNDINLLRKTNFIAKYCAAAPPSHYKFIGSVFKKINLLSGK